MNRIARLAALTLAFGTIAAATTPASAACKQIGAVGTGVTTDLAKFMADAALKNIREAQGYSKASGATTYKCETGMIATDCHARQKVCQ